MTTTILAGLLLALTATGGGSLVVSESTPQLAVQITYGMDKEGDLMGPIKIAPDWSSRETCDLAEFAKAATEVAKYLNRSDDLTMSDAVYRSPAMVLRNAAAEMEARDAAISAFREQLKKCAWMAEPGAFDRKP